MKKKERFFVDCDGNKFGDANTVYKWQSVKLNANANFEIFLF